MKKEEVESFEKLHIQIKGIYAELGILSKKSPDGVINKFKLKFVNQLLKESNLILGENYRPFSDFDFFNDDDLPTNSDVVLVISQYIKCLERLKNDNTYWDGSYFWRIENSKISIETTRPDLH